MKLSFALLISALAAATAATDAETLYDVDSCVQHNKPKASGCESTITTNYALQTKAGNYISFAESKNIVKQVPEIGVAEEFTTEFLEESGVAAIKSVYRDTYLRMRPQAEKVTQSKFIGGWSKLKIVETTSSPEQYTEIGIRGIQFDRFLRAPEADLKVVDQVENYLSADERFTQIPITQCSLETSTGNVITPGATGEKRLEVKPEVTEESRYQLIQHEDHVLLRNVVNAKYLQINSVTLAIEETEAKEIRPAQQWNIEAGTLDTTFALKNMEQNTYIAIDVKPEAETPTVGEDESPVEKAAPEDLILAPADTPSETTMLRCSQAAPIAL